MRIDYNNKNILQKEEIYIHDSTFEGFTYQEEEQKVSFRLKNGFLNKLFKIDFYNTIGINCQLCKFWGGGDSVIDFDLWNGENLIEELKKIHDEKYENEHTLLDEGTDYIEAYFIMNSGDEIRIACEYIIFEEEPLEEDENQQISKNI